MGEEDASSNDDMMIELDDWEHFALIGAIRRDKSNPNSWEYRAIYNTVWYSQ
jgi:hypothetical protein